MNKNKKGNKQQTFKKKRFKLKKGSNIFGTTWIVNITNRQEKEAPKTMEKFK